MLDKINLNKKMSKKDYKKQAAVLGTRLAELQRALKNEKIPVTIIVEGFGASGKGTLINELIQPLDSHAFRVFTTQKPSEEEAMRPYFWRFWTKLPENGKIHIFDRSWYKDIVEGYVTGRTSRMEMQKRLSDAIDYEQELTVDGMVMIKLFLYISKEEQKKRLKNLESNEATEWRVDSKDWEDYKNYKKWLAGYEEMLQTTDTDFGKWAVIESNDREYASIKILNTVCKAFEEALEKNAERKAVHFAEETVKSAEEAVRTETSPNKNIEENIISPMKASVLDGIDLSKKLTKKEYNEKLEKLQTRMAELHSVMYRKRIPVILAFEGWDAGGKGGAINRLTRTMDPRGYEVIPTSAPNDVEKAHHYLWRFWNKVPKAGHAAIFDRTWYGRVMVERIEGFCTEPEWKRAYNEINQMEAQWAAEGAVVLKFWMHIDKDEQKRRFEERMTNPNKQWKITDEDWRNRDKWNEYVEAVDEMIIRTSTSYAPWIVVEGNDKRYARIKVLESVVEAIEAKLKA